MRACSQDDPYSSSRKKRRQQCMMKYLATHIQSPGKRLGASDTTSPSASLIVISTVKLTSTNCQSSAKLGLKTIKNNDPFHKLHFLHGQYFGCLLLLIQSSWWSHTVTPCPYSRKCFQHFATTAMRAIYDDSMNSSKLLLLKIHSHVYCAVDSEPFTEHLNVWKRWCQPCMHQNLGNGLFP